MKLKFPKIALTRQEKTVAVFLVVSALIGSVVLLAKAWKPQGGRRQAVIQEQARTRMESREKPAKPALNLNSATAAELMRVPGLGPVLANQIVRYREQNGFFRNLSDLRQVPGFGRRRLSQVSPHLFISQTVASQPPPGVGAR